MSFLENISFPEAMLFLIAWIGHACLWCHCLNISYGLPISKMILRPWRLLCGVMILFGFPVIFEMYFRHYAASGYQFPGPLWYYYIAPCLAIGIAALPLVTIARNLRRKPACLIHQESRFLPLWKTRGELLIGDGAWRRVVHFPFNDPFTVEFTEITLKLESLPPALEDLTILLLSDFHFYGSPSPAYFEAIFQEIESQPTPDIVALGGDYLDAMRYHDWLAPLLGRLKWKEAGFAILGNHDHKYEPDAIRWTLSGLGFTVLSNTCKVMTIRGERVMVIGNETPWNRPGPLVAKTQTDFFRLCLSHTPDNFYWAIRRNINLVLCGHTHGGQIRLPILGSIFVPCTTGRRFDQGVFQNGRTAMVVSRGLGGKEPLRINCPPQVLRIKLQA